MKKNINYFYLSFFTLAVVLAGLLTLEVVGKKMPILDKWASPLIADLEGTFIFNSFRWITELGSGTFIAPFTIIMSIALWKYSKDWLASITCASGTLVGYGLNYFIKYLVERERPRILAVVEGEGFSFPSGHAMVSMVVYGLFIYFFVKYTKSVHAAIWINAIGITAIIFIGLSRYMIRVHYLTDVVGGFAFGFIFLLLWIKVYQVVNKKVKRY